MRERHTHAANADNSIADGVFAGGLAGRLVVAAAASLIVLGLLFWGLGG